MPAVFSLLKLWQLTLPLQGLGQAHPIQHPGQLPTTPAVGPPHTQSGRVGRLVRVGASPWGTDLCQAAPHRWSHPRREQVTRNVFRDVGVSLQRKGWLCGLPRGALGTELI